MRRMPGSLKLVLALLACGVVGALASGIVQYEQKEKRIEVLAEHLTGGHVDAGKQAIPRYGCGGCHRIDGITAAEGRVGPELAGIAVRSLVAGKLTNTPANLILWIRHPQHVSPGSGMPEQPMSEQDARDIAAYLYTLR